MKPKFKVGDKIYIKWYDGEVMDRPATITRISKDQNGYRYWNDYHSHETYANVDETIAAEIFESPLYNALQEEQT